MLCITGQTAEALGDYDRAIASYESALRHNAYSVIALSQIAAICRSKEEFRKAAEYFGRVVGIAPDSGDVWGALGEFSSVMTVSYSPACSELSTHELPNERTVRGSRGQARHHTFGIACLPKVLFHRGRPQTRACRRPFTGLMAHVRVESSHREQNFLPPARVSSALTFAPLLGSAMRSNNRSLLPDDRRPQKSLQLVSAGVVLHAQSSGELATAQPFIQFQTGTLIEI